MKLKKKKKFRNTCTYCSCMKDVQVFQVSFASIFFESLYETQTYDRCKRFYRIYKFHIIFQIRVYNLLQKLIINELILVLVNFVNTQLMNFYFPTKTKIDGFFYMSNVNTLKKLIFYLLYFLFTFLATTNQRC